MSTNTVPTTGDETRPRSSVTHEIGDVRVTIDLPAGCPPPSLSLTVYEADTTAEDRAAALVAFGLTAADLVRYDDNRWVTVGDRLSTGGASATVFLDEGDVESIVPPAPAEATS